MEEGREEEIKGKRKREKDLALLIGTLSPLGQSSMLRTPFNLSYLL